MARSGSAGGGGASAGAIRAGQAFVEMSLKDNKLIRGLDNLKGRLQHTAKIVAAIGAGGIGAGASILSALGGVTASTVGKGAELQKYADRLGTTVEVLSTLGYAARSVGMPLEELVDTLADLQEKLSDAANGGAVAEQFAEIGISAKELVKVPADQKLYAMADAMKGLAKEGKLVRIANATMGEGGKKLAGILDRGSAAFRELAEEAKQVGAVISNDDARRATENWKAFNRTLAVAEGVVFQVGTALMPGAYLLKMFNENLIAGGQSARDFVANNQMAIVGVAGLAGTLVVGGAALIGLAGAVTVTTTLVGGLATAVGAVVSPIGLAVAATGALGYQFVTTTEQGKKLQGWVSTALPAAFQSAAGTITTAWAGISDSLKAGDLATAASIAMKGLQLEMTKGRLEIFKIWSGIQTDFQTGIMVIKDHLGISQLQTTLETLRAELAAVKEKDKPAPGSSPDATPPGSRGGGTTIGGMRVESGAVIFDMALDGLSKWIKGGAGDMQHDAAVAWNRLQNGVGLLSDKDARDRHQAMGEMQQDETANAAGKIAEFIAEAAKVTNEGEAKFQQQIEKMRTELVAASWKAMNAAKRANPIINPPEAAPMPRGVQDAIKGIQESVVRSSRGAFDSRSFAALFGGGISVEQRQLAEAKKIAAGVNKMVDKLDEAGPLVFGQ